MKSDGAPKLIVEALLQQFLPTAKHQIETAQTQDGQYVSPSDRAYDQVLDSLSMVARHTPIPLLEALLRWRESESPKGASDTPTFQRKLAVECTFCSACIRFVECCPHEGLTEKLWTGIENFVFDWLINADRVISQVDYPSLADLRGFLLDQVARLLGALSHIRFNSVTERFFMELNTRRIDTSIARSETLSIIHGMRYLKLEVKSEVGLNASTSFLAKSNPLNRSPHKRKSQLHHALCRMLSSMLAPIADGARGHWPPIGIEPALNLWYEAVGRIRVQLIYWLEKQSKHLTDGYPLVTLLLCLGEPQIFLNNFGLHMEQLYKLIRDKSHRSMALDCLHRVLRFYLSVYAPNHPPNRVWDYLDSVTSQLLTVLRKGMFTQDVQHDKFVEFCVTIAESNLDFSMNHLILELLKQDSHCDAKVIGLRALNKINAPPPTQNQYNCLEISQVHNIGHYSSKVKVAIEAILRSSHRIFCQALLTSSKNIVDPVIKDKSQAYLFRSALKCIPDLIEEVGRSDKMCEIIPQHMISVDPGVREEAMMVLNRIVKSSPQRRFMVIRGVANFILRLPDEFPHLIQTSLGHLLELMCLWRVCLLEERLEFDDQDSHHAMKDNNNNNNSVTRKPSVQQYGEANEFRAQEIDFVCLIFLCSMDNQIRHTTIELLRCVRALRNDIKEYALHETEDDILRIDAEPILIIDVLEEHGDDFVLGCYCDSGRPIDLRWESDIVPSDVTILSILFESIDKNRWACCLCELVNYAAELCPKSIQAAKIEVIRRLAHITPFELGGKANQSLEGESKVDQWLMYAMFACACPPDNRESGNFKSTKDLFRLILPSLKSGCESQVHAATMALGHSHFEICEVMFSELSIFVDEVSHEIEGKPKWKTLKSRREELRVHIANIYRSVAEKIWPGMINKKHVLRLHFMKFIEDTTKQILIVSTSESFQEMQTLRYALASVLRYLAPEFVESKSEKFDLRTRKRLFDLLLFWSDDSSGSWTQDGLCDYRREVEKYKSSLHGRTKDYVDKLSFDKELNEQVEAIQWASMNAMASLLYGPCFDDNAKKMSGRVISWINSLFVEPTPRAPFGYSMDPKTPSYVKKNGEGGRGQHKGGHHHVNLAKLALKNLLFTNLELFLPCIDQCYYSNVAVADGYFSVLAEVYMRQEVPNCEVQRLLSLILYKVVDPSRQIRDDALQMLETLSMRHWVGDRLEASGGYRAAVVGNLPDSYQQFQYKLSSKLAKDHPELSQLLCEEIMQRQLDSVDIIAQHQVLTCMAPWIENLDFWKLEDGWTERLLKSLYYVTWRHGDQFPDEIEKLWSTIATKSRNISPVLDFLLNKGIEDCDSNASTEISGAFATYFSVAKRMSLYLARICPQGTIDHLVCQLAQQRLQDSVEPLRLKADLNNSNNNGMLEFYQGPPPSVHVAPIMSTPSLGKGSLDVPLRNANGTMSWRNARIASLPPELNNIIPLAPSSRSGQLFPTSLFDISTGPLMGVRSSIGTIRGGRHASRDSVDFLNLMDTSNSEEELLSSMIMQGVTAKELQFALQGHQHQQHCLSRADIALILLAEIAYENDEDFREYLPLLFHVTFVSMDSSEEIVLEHCQHLLVNLLYSLAARHLELYGEGEDNDGENKQQVINLIKYVQSKRGSIMWENEDPTILRPHLSSATLLSALVQSMVDAIFFQGDLRETWGNEALQWAIECTSRHLACRSHQIYRALRPKVTSDACFSLLRCLYICLGNPVSEVLGFVMEILLTLQVIVENLEPEKVILYPQLFWACIALMHLEFIHVYSQVLELFVRILDRLSLVEKTTENVLLSSMPRKKLDNSGPFTLVEYQRTSEPSKFPTFEGVQPLILKGLMSPISHNVSIEVLLRITLPTCDSIFGDSETRLLMHVIGLLPWLCLQLSNEAINNQYHKAWCVASSISVWCRENSLDDLSNIFQAYSRGEFKTIYNLLACVAPLLSNEWFPKHSVLAFGHLLRLLERGPIEYKEVTLLILKELLQYTSVDPAQNPRMYEIVSQLVENSLGCHALSVLEALLQNCSSPSGMDGLDEKFLAPKPSFKAASSTRSESKLPPREVALQNARLILGRVLDTCSHGRRDYKRLVPFVSNLGHS